MNLLRLVAIGLPTLFSFWLSCVHYTEPNQAAVTWNLFSGEVWIDVVAGLNVNTPWVLVARIDKRPVRVCISTRGRGFNCKLVEFVPSGWKELLKVEGFRYYWWDNRISFNWGYERSEEHRGVKDLLRGHAYGVQKYSFIKILRDFKEGE